MMKKIIYMLFVWIFAASAAQASAAADFTEELPQSHWVYDAVRQLQAKGVLRHYREGDFKKSVSANRYEVASLLAQELYRVDGNIAGREEAEMIERLANEFRYELEALGVRAGDFGGRFSVISDDIGGWKFSGELRLDAKFSGDNDTKNLYTNTRLTGKTEFDMQYYRIYMSRRINADTSFFARIDAGYASNSNAPQPVQWGNYYITTKLPYGVSLSAGHQTIDWENELRLVRDNDSYYGDVSGNSFLFSKSWGAADLKFAVTDYEHGEWTSRYRSGVARDMLFSVNANFDVNEKFRTGLFGYWLREEDLSEINGVTAPSGDYGVDTYGAYFGRRFSPDAELKGVYYLQRHGGASAPVYSGSAPGLPGYEDSASAWKLVLDLNQNMLKFASLWAEYGEIDNNFMLFDYESPYAPFGADVLNNRPGADRLRIGNTNTTRVYAVFLDRWWWANGLWHAFARFVRADFGVDGLDDATNWSVGLGRRLQSGVDLELAYDAIDYGSGNPGGFLNGRDHIVRFRTYVAF